MDTDVTMPSWPANHRAALAIVVLIPNLWAMDKTTGSTTGIEYSADGLRRLLSSLADIDVSATFALADPDQEIGAQLSGQLADLGHEVVANRTTQTGRTSELPSNVTPLPASYGAVVGLPGSPQASDTALDLAWVIDGRSGEVPAMVEGSLARTVHIPVSPYWTDATWLDPLRPLPPSSLLEHWSVSLADVRTQGGLMTVVLHPHIAGRPGILSQIMRFLDDAVDSGDVWMTTVGNVAAWWKQQHP